MMRNGMNAEQGTLFDILPRILAHDFRVHEPTYHRPTFIMGKPGREKTVLDDAISTAARSESRIILIVGTSALAASLYKRERTAHMLFRIPVVEVNISQTYHDSSLICNFRITLTFNTRRIDTGVFRDCLGRTANG